MAMLRKEHGGDMPTIIEEIISIDSSDISEYLELQKRRLAQLQKIQKKKASEKRKQQQIIISELVSAGILDEKGNLAKPYTDNE